MYIRWNVREIAEPARWNPHNLAEASGLAYNTVWGIWNNKARRMDLDTLAALATALGVNPCDLLAVEYQQGGGYDDGGEHYAEY